MAEKGIHVETTAGSMDDDAGRKPWKEAWRASWRDLLTGSQGPEIQSILLRAPSPPTVNEIPGAYVVQEWQGMKGAQGARETKDLQSLHALTLEELRRHVRGSLTGLDGEVDQWKARRDKGLKKTGRRVEEFVQEFDAFLAGFAGIVEVVKMADNQYGGAASAVLFILFATAKAKAGNDRAILSSIKLLAHRLPDLEIYYQIYADNTLAKMLSTAYVSVMLFAREATAYFQGRGIDRVLKGLAQPKAFADLQQGMVQDFQAIRIRCDALISARVYELSLQNKIQKLKETIQNIHDEDASRHLRKSLLRPGQAEPTPQSARTTQLDDYARILALAFREYRDDFAGLTLGQLKSSPEFRDWTAAPSSLLLLYGRNHPYCSKPPQSWLSPVAVDFLASLRTADKEDKKDKDRIVAHVLGSRDGCSSAPDVLAALADQILEQQPQALRRGSAIDRLAFQAHDATLTGRGQVLQTLLDHCAARPVFVLLDRPDQCCGDETWTVVLLLLRLVRQTPARLKVLLVIRSGVWDVEGRLDSLEAEWLAAKSVVLLRRDQEELDR